MDFRGITINFILVALFTISLFGFMTTWAINNDATVSVANEPLLSSLNESLVSNLQNASTQSQTSLNAYANETSRPVTTSIGFYFNSIILTGNIFMNLTFGFFSNLFLATAAILHLDPIIFGTMLVILVVIMILAVWRLLRAGE